jgi:hypothetical protein
MRTAKDIAVLGLVLSALLALISPLDAQQIHLAPPQQPIPDGYFGMHIHGIDVPRFV